MLHDTGKRVLTFPELAARHPALVGTGQVRNRVRRMHEAIRGNLDKWKKVIAAPPCTHVRAGQFRHDAEGRLLRAIARAKRFAQTVGPHADQEGPEARSGPGAERPGASAGGEGSKKQRTAPKARKGGPHWNPVEILVGGRQPELPNANRLLAPLLWSAIPNPSPKV